MPVWPCSLLPGLLLCFWFILIFFNRCLGGLQAAVVSLRGVKRRCCLKVLQRYLSSIMASSFPTSFFMLYIIVWLTVHVLYRGAGIRSVNIIIQSPATVFILSGWKLYVYETVCVQWTILISRIVFLMFVPSSVDAGVWSPRRFCLSETGFPLALHNC